MGARYTMRTVIRSPNWIGDGIMSLPAIRALKDHFPDDPLTVVSRNHLADIYQNVPEIEGIIRIPDRMTIGGYLKTANEIRRGRFARGILFANSFNSALLFTLAGIRERIGYDRDGRRLLLTHPVSVRPSGGHHYTYYLKIVEEVCGGKLGRIYPDDLVLTEAEKSEGASLIRAAGVDPVRPLIAISPVSAYGSAKEWLPENFSDLIRSLKSMRPGVEIILLGSQKEKRKVDLIAGDAQVPVHNLAGRFKLRETILVLSRCRLAITNDSGIMHVASSLRVPLVAIFGPTIAGETAPLSSAHAVIHHPPECAPCRFRECPTDHRCMKAVSVAEVLAAGSRLLEAPMASPDPP